MKIDITRRTLQQIRDMLDSYSTIMLNGAGIAPFEDTRQEYWDRYQEATRLVAHLDSLLNESQDG